MSNIEPFKKKKEDKSPTFSFSDSFMAKASGEPESKIDGVGTMETKPEEKPAKPPNYNDILRDMFEREFMLSAGDYGIAEKYFQGPMTREEYNRPVEKVSLEEALRREFQLCRGGRHSIGFHIERTLEYIRQYNANKKH